jgi:Protein of unknown function (DUF4230)
VERIAQTVVKGVAAVDKADRVAKRVLLGAGAVIAAIAALVVLALVLAAVHLLPQLRNPFVTTTTVRSGPAVLKSVTALSRYEAASGTFQVVVDLSQHTSFLPSFLAGTQTLFIGDGAVIAYENFAGLKGGAIRVSPDRTAVSIRLPAAQLEPATLNVRQSYVFASQTGLLSRIGSFFSGNPNNQQAVYIAADQKINTAAAQSGLVTDAERNTRAMLDSMLTSLGFRHITVTFGAK